MVLACGRRWGKTDACAAETLGALHQPSPTRHVLIAPTLDQARLLFDRVVAMLERLRGDVGGAADRPDRTYTTYTSYPKAPGGRARAKTTELPNFKISRSPYPKLVYGPHTVIARSGHVGRSLRGNEATHIVIDEAAFVPEDLITEVAMPMLATTDGRLTMLSTPRGMNHFWRFFRMGRDGLHGVWSRRAPSSESPFVSPGFLQVQRELISERAFRVEYGAEFLDSSGQLFRTESVEKCLVPRLERPAEPPFFIGVDWARYSDFTAVAVLCGRREQAQLLETRRFHGIAWSEQIERVREIALKYGHARVLCDGTAVGDPLVEALCDALPRSSVKGFVFTQSTKAQLIDGLAWLLERGALRMEPDPELLRELEHFTATETDSGHAKMGARGGYHDDLVIALALACRLLPRGPGLGVRIGGNREFSGSDENVISQRGRR